MSSQHSLSDLLIRIPEWTTQELQAKINDVIPVLTNSLGTCDEDASPLLLKCVESLLVYCLPCLPPASLEKLVFQKTLPVTKKLFLQALNVIEENLQNKDAVDLVDVLSCLLQVCIEILGYLSQALHYVSSLGQIPVEYVASLPGNLASILLGAFRHCRESETVYGDLFQAVSGSLTAMFRKTHEMQVNYFSVISTTVNFNCAYEDELSLLVEVMEQLALTQEIVYGLDITSLAEQLKGYTKLAEKYADHLKPRLDVSKPIGFLCLDIKDNLEKNVFMDFVDAKQLTKELKILSFKLKVVLKLCEQYADYLGECHSNLLQLLISLFRAASIRLQLYHNTREEVIKDIESYVSVAAEPLITLLIADCNFAEEFFKYSETVPDNDDDRCVAHLLLCLNILKKLIKSEKDCRKLWFGTEQRNNILQTVFSLVGYCHLAFNWELKIPSGTVHTTTRKTATDFYEVVLIHVISFTMSVSENEFYIVEQLMLQNILQTDFWKALLGVDLWCFVGRYGSAELCYEHVVFLLDLLKCVSKPIIFPETTFLEVLVHRLFPLLPKSFQMRIAEKYPFLKNLALWKVLGLHYIPEGVDLLSVCSTFVNMKSLPPTADTFINVLNAVDCIPVLSTPDTARNVSAGIVTLWNGVDVSCKTTWMQKLIIILSSGTVVLLPYMSGYHLHKVLERLKDVPNRSDLPVKLATLNILKNLATRFIEACKEQTQIINNITRLFSDLINDDSPIVRQTSLETFVYFAQLTQHEQIVMDVPRRRDTARGKITAYLRQVLPPEPNRKSQMEYFCRQLRFSYVHRCYKQVTNSEDVQPPPKKSKIQVPAADARKAVLAPAADARKAVLAPAADVHKAISAMRENLSVVVKCAQQSELTVDMKEELDVIKRQLTCLL